MGALSRRQFLQGSLALAGIGLLAGCGIIPPWVQSPPKVPRIGFLSPGSPLPPNTSVFFRALADLGYIDGQNIMIEQRYAEGNANRMPELAADLVKLAPDLIVAVADQAATVARDATTTTPVVFLGVGDPVASGLVQSLARPGGSMTGVVYVAPGVSTKRLELLKETAPGIARVAVITGLINPSQPLMEQAGPALGVQLEFLRVGSVGDLEQVFDAVASSGVDALLVSAEGILTDQRARLIDFAAQRRLPAIYSARAFVADGGLMSYSPNLPEMNHRAAALVDKILKGTKPADLPVELPTKFDFIVNLKTAQALGLTIPQSMLQQATEVIQ